MIEEKKKPLIRKRRLVEKPRKAIIREKKPVNKQKIFTVIAASVLVLAHVAILLAIFWSYKFYDIYPTLFGSIVAVVLLVMMIIDIIFFVGFNHKDLALKIISTTLAVLLLIGGTVGSVYLGKVNNVISNILDDGKTEKYETFSGVFVSYDQYNKFSSLSELSGKKVGMLTETTDGISFIATGLLKDEKIDYATVDYKTNSELLTALIDGDVDAVVITSGYRDIIKADDSSAFTQYLNHFVDFNKFEKDLKVVTNKKTKNISIEPFNVLLIGWSRTDIGSTVGLADAIIVATINPQTYTVSMMSIARDSFVPIACYGGAYDKINSGRSTSRACFIETVEQFTGMDMDYYIEMDYLGLVQVVNAIGGIYIDNPVTFTLDGIYVEAGHYLADGQQVLQFCRERHHMPNGDFDRQQHQKECIIAICKKFIEAGDVSLALYAMEEASEYMSTDFTLSELTSVFNLLLNTKNYTTMETFDLVDFHTLRITGYGGIMYYSYDMRLPLWVYLIYKGSYDESINHIHEVMGEYKTIKQDSNFEFDITKTYTRPDFYSTEYDDVFLYEPEPMPAFWANMAGMTESEALAWAASKGVSLTVKTINQGSPDYDAEYEGLVGAQSPRYGSLISEYKSGTIYVMGHSSSTADDGKHIPSFYNRSIAAVKEWAKKYDIKVRIEYTFDGAEDVNPGRVVRTEPSSGNLIEDCTTLYVYLKPADCVITYNSNGHGTAPGNQKFTTGDDRPLSTMKSPVTDSEGTWIFEGWYTAEGMLVTSTADLSGNTTLFAKWKKGSETKNYTITLNANGGYFESEGGSTITISSTKDRFPTPTRSGNYTFDGFYTSASGGSRVYSPSDVTSDTTLYAHWKEGSGGSSSGQPTSCDHDWQLQSIITEPTCDSEGSGEYKCSKCSETKTMSIPKKTDGCSAHEHSYSSSITTYPTCVSTGVRTYTCECGASYTEEIPIDETAHDWVEATCTEARHCSRCGATDGEPLSGEACSTD